ncbi:MAG: MarR family transcriptional regulator [Actinomycetes bacterium]|jgi:DNA-binding MarR family transcriptional regulator|nr:MarR family transcriptional regulator [Acidimicrobiia bacterium]
MSKDLDPIAEARRQWEAHGWESAAPGMTAVTTLVRVHQILIERIERALAPFGLTFARFEILRLLGFSRRGRLPMGKIGERLQVHPASVTSAVKRLERDGLLRRTQDEVDGRIVLAELSDAGRRLLEPATAAVNAVFEDLGLSGNEVDDLISLLDRVRHANGDGTLP